ncbi:MAG: YggS family pyridoxal phosphate-dependent enzyme [Porticoccaceae bacterium]|nr:YggS family pyridoxal phosphate-dependent enzyme [Porticoccaceae bacterium]
MPTIEKNIADVKARIQAAAQLADRDPSDLLLMAVSKTRVAEDVRVAATCGIDSFGENYLQEALEKIAAVEPLATEWHFIGPLQSNKTKQVAENFSWVHTVDRIKIAQRLSAQRPAALGALNVCLQVNIDREASKSGLMAEEALKMAFSVAQMPNLRLRGLMAIPKSRSGLDSQREPFRKLRLLKNQINQALDNSQKLDTLSMGMSEDIEAAIYEGATILRVGTDIFGQRNS